MTILPIQKILLETKLTQVVDGEIIKTGNYEIHVGKCIVNPDLSN